MRQICSTLLLGLASACSPLSPSSCGTGVPLSQYGAYAPPFKRLQLPDGSSLTVYRVKHWTFTEDSATALQLEFQTLVPITDTLALRSQAATVWPVFARYVEQLGVSHALLTATDLRPDRGSVVSTGTIRSFGIMLVRDSAGVWRYRAGGQLLPPIAQFHSDVGIFEANGKEFQVPAAP